MVSRNREQTQRVLDQVVGQGEVALVLDFEWERPTRGDPVVICVGRRVETYPDFRERDYQHQIVPGCNYQEEYRSLQLHHMQAWLVVGASLRSLPHVRKAAADCLGLDESRGDQIHLVKLRT